MSTTETANADQLNYINIGLILLACGVAFFVPFELFLFSYAILGPAHYLTEISWLHERNYFAQGRLNHVFLGTAGLALFLIVYANPQFKVFDAQTGEQMSTAVTYIAFASSLALVVLQKTLHRLIAILLVCASAYASTGAFLFFSVFLPSLIHVFIFTGLFMLYGALKERSKSGYLTCAVFALCPLLFIFITPGAKPVSQYILDYYPMFHVLNVAVLKLINADIFKTFNPPIAAVYKSDLGLIVMRFIAFAYTYHYLNWFSKTSVIKWHQVPKKHLMTVGGLWAVSVAFYLYDYKIGFHVLYLLSILHVFLEFPLNHVSIIGIFKEISMADKAPATAKGT
jgi:hypothetical protein